MLIISFLLAILFGGILAGPLGILIGVLIVGFTAIANKR